MNIPSRIVSWLPFLRRWQKPIPYKRGLYAEYRIVSYPNRGGFIGQWRPNTDGPWDVLIETDELLRAGSTEYLHCKWFSELDMAGRLTAISEYEDRQGMREAA